MSFLNLPSSLVVALLLVTAAFGGAAPSAEAQVKGMTIAPSTNRPGEDYRSFSTDEPPEMCASACAEEARCMAFTYVKPGVQGPQARCWLKSKVPDAQPNDETVSGVKQPSNAPDNWSEPTFTTRDTVLADVIVRVGDIDNLGFGWPRGFSPFSGRSTPAHTYPFQPTSTDPPGTDRILIGTGFSGTPAGQSDGYSESGTASEPINIPTDLDGVAVNTLALQLFLDDFQAPRYGSQFQVRLDGERYPVMEDVLNALNQTGPIGKLVTVEILPEYHDLLSDGTLTLLIDDPTTGAGDGFAIDFVQLLVNPQTFPSTGALSGRVTNAETGEPLAGALVSSALDGVETGSDGRYRLDAQPAGLMVVRAAHPGFSSISQPVDLIADSVATANLTLTPQSESEQIGRNLETEGRVRLRNILFSTGSATIKASSEPTLQAVRRAMENRPDARFVIEGHTDRKGSAASNQTLSRKRAQAVVTWLTERGIDAGRLDTAGYGESRPVTSNDTAAGRRLNRRVEIVVAK